MEAGADPVAFEKAKLRRRRILFVAVAVLILIPTAAMVVVNHIDTPAPPPHFTKDALPAPADEHNGWPLIAHYHSTTISGIRLDPLDKLLAVSKDGTPLPELTRLFSPARVVAAKITEHTKLCSQAFERERMVIPCLSLEPDVCTTEPLEICARLVAFAALDEAARGRPRAASRTAQVLRQLNDAAANSPHPWMQTRSLLLLREAIHHAATIIKWRRIDATPIREAITAISLPEKHLVIASYLLKHLALEQALSRTDTWLLDRGAIMQGLNRPFGVASRGEPLPPPSDHTVGAFWWVDNPIGDKMLDALEPGADEDFLEAQKLRASVLKRREEALKLE